MGVLEKPPVVDTALVQALGSSSRGQGWVYLEASLLGREARDGGNPGKGSRRVDIIEDMSKRSKEIGAEIFDVRGRVMRMEIC